MAPCGDWETKLLFYSLHAELNTGQTAEGFSEIPFLGLQSCCSLCAHPCLRKGSPATTLPTGCWTWSAGSWSLMECWSSAPVPVAWAASPRGEHQGCTLGVCFWVESCRTHRCCLTRKALDSFFISSSETSCFAPHRCASWNLAAHERSVNWVCEFTRLCCCSVSHCCQLLGCIIPIPFSAHSPWPPTLCARLTFCHSFACFRM